MNIIEALKKDRPYKRKSWERYAEPVDPKLGYYTIHFEVSDLLAEDWEIEEEKVTISMTKTEWWDMVRDSIVAFDRERNLPIERIMDSSIGILAEKLGFR